MTFFRVPDFRIIVFCLFALLCSRGFTGSLNAQEQPATIVDFPHYVLEHNDLRLLVVDPLTPNGYYQGQRFAHTAMVAQAYWKGIPFFAEFTANKPPTANDHAGGNAEEFDINGPDSFPPEAGDAPFLKIGVGLLRRPAGELEKAYRFHGRYDWVAKPSIRVHRPDTRQIVFEERLEDATSGLGYALISTVAIHEDGTGFDVTRNLTNLGREPLTTEHYSHNFTRVADLPIGSAYRVAWSEPLPWTEINGVENGLVVSPTDLSFDRDAMEKGIYLATDPEVNADLQMQFEVVVPKVDLRLKIIPDRAIYRAAVWGQPSVISPEPFVRISAAPGESHQWSTHYTIEPIRTAND